jgi:restriction system protein
VDTFVLVAAAFVAGVGLGWWRRLAAENSGERGVRKRLVAAFVGDGAHLMNNVTVPFEDGTTQIDHILFSRRGIFVIESKHYSGWIFAGEKSRVWTQVIYKVKNTFQNPLRQNYKHCLAVRALLDFMPASDIHSIVVFTGDAEFKTPIPPGVFTPEGMIRHIQGFSADALSENRLQFCVGRIECKRLALTHETDMQHQGWLENRFKI